MILTDLLGLSKDKLKDETLRIVFSLVVGFLILIIVQSVKTNISKCPVYKSHGNICLEQMDFINKRMFGNIFNNPLVTFIFVLGLNLVLTYFIFEVFKECIPKSMSGGSSSGNGSIGSGLGFYNRGKSIRNKNNVEDNVEDIMTGCPFGFGKRKKRKIDRGCHFMEGCLKGNFINEKDLKEEITKGLGDVNVSVASNVDLNECGEKETNIIKEVLDGVLPGLFPKVIDALCKKKENEKVIENKGDVKNNTEKENVTKERSKEENKEKLKDKIKEDIEDLKNKRKETSEQTKEFGNKLNDLLGGFKNLLKNQDVLNIEGFDLGSLIN